MSSTKDYLVRINKDADYERFEQSFKAGQCHRALYYKESKHYYIKGCVFFSRELTIIRELPPKGVTN